MRYSVLAAIFAGLSGSALAEDAPQGTGMQLTVRPSGYDSHPNEAQERQERLLKRMEQSDHMIRSICRNCGDGWKHQIYAPFNPYASLKPSDRLSEDTND